MVQYYAKIAVLNAFDRILTYSVNIEDLHKAQNGVVVSVACGSSKLLGVILEKTTTLDADFKVKPILYYYEDFVLSKSLIEFAKRTAKYNLSPIGMVLKMCLSVPKAITEPKQEYVYNINKEFISKENRASSARSSIFQSFRSVKLQTKQQLKENSGATISIIDSMVKDKMLVKSKINKYLVPLINIPEKINYKPIELNENQESVFNSLKKVIDSNRYSASLIDGVTGSGKTEVFFAIMEHSLKNHENSQVLVLLPEISLSSQMFNRFKDKFGIEPTLWHSGLTPAKRMQNWHDIYFGKARIILGARSALYLPFKDLQLIVVDEEHESSYKQEDNVTYNARDMAVLRASLEQIPVILASATPSLETLNNAKNGKYNHFILSARHKALMPTIKPIDMRPSSKTQNYKWFSKDLYNAINENLNNKRQVLLFLNRRGYSPLTVCRECGHKMNCKNCSSSLVRHDRINKLLCHLCGYRVNIPESCPTCHHINSFVACGPGVERIAAQVKELWPNATYAIMDSDYSEENLKLMQDVTDGKIDIIIGTQMIAKGYHFPNLSLVGVVDADIGLQGGDLRASERCFQLLHQVSGRAGREKYDGTVLVQTYQPENLVIKAITLNDRDSFMKSELAGRQFCKMPPYSRLVAIVIAGKDQAQVQKAASIIAKSCPKNDKVQLLGPVSAPIFFMRNNYRYRILIKSDLNFPVQAWLKSWLPKVKILSSIKVKLDVDPQNFS